MTDRAAVRLTTLGPIELTGPDPAACERVLAQPKRLALLVYLAARPGDRVNRDRILATFWPESPAKRAQANLRTGLYYLRRTLGSDLITTHGRAVGIAPRGLSCDAAQLLGGAASGSPAALLQLYRGEFLDAFHVASGPDFERWVDRTRAALRARATEIAWTLAADAEADGEWISAAHYARRAAELAVDVEGATQRLIALLLRAGDGGAAVAEYERLAWRLDEEFGIPPSPETSALIADVRRRPATPHDTPAKSASIGQDRPRSLAVLPFEDLSEGSGAYLASGLAEDLRTTLARIRDVRVVSRTSVRRFEQQRPTSIQAVRELLGVDLVLEGSVQLRGDRCRITVQLIDARGDQHLWAETYDRSLADVFAVQSDLALRVARALEAELSPREHRRLRRPSTTDLRAWQLYLKGRELWNHRHPADAVRAARLFRQALDLDDRFAPAWVGLADAELVGAAFGAGELARATRRAKEYIRRALDCDPESGEARATLGLILSFFDWDFAAAGTEYRRAVEQSPGYATAHQWYGNWLCAHGEPDRGLAELHLAIELDPLSPVVSDSLGLALMQVGRPGEAESQFRQILGWDPDFWRARFHLAICCARRGDLRAAARELVAVWAAGGWGAEPRDAPEAARLLERDPRAVLAHLLRSAHSLKGNRPIRTAEIVLLMLLGRYDDAVAAVVRGRYQRWMAMLPVYSPLLDPLAGNPRFRRAVEEAGIMLPRWRRIAPAADSS